VPPRPQAVRHEHNVAQKILLAAAAAAVLAILLPATPATARPFSSKSPLNKPIPRGAATHPGSAKMIDLLAAAGADGGFRVSLRHWTVPVYVASRRTRRVRVRLTASWAPRNAMYRVPIPRRAAADPQGDGHLAIVDRARGCEYDFWQARKGSRGWSASWGNTIRTGSTGIFPYGLSARASGFALTAGVIFPSEIARRRINHALVFAYPYVRRGRPVRPATQSDGTDSRAAALPMGARLQLRRGLNIRRLGLSPWQRTIARALKRYGMFLGDTGGTVALRAVSRQSYGRNPYRGALRKSSTVALPEVLLRHMRVLRFRPYTPRRPRVARTGCAPMR
jgi:hypothetical protein